MKTKTSELTGAALDWAVAKCLGTEHLFAGHEVGRLHYSLVFPTRRNFHHRSLKTSYAIAHHVRKMIELVPHTDALWDAMYRDQHIPNEGPTPLIAAMRCYVASKLGDEVEIPDELI